MLYQQKSLTCKRLGKKFRVIECLFDYNVEPDTSILDSLITKGEDLATKLNPVLARDASFNRDFETVKINAVAGVIAEFCWKLWLQMAVSSHNNTCTINIIDEKMVTPMKQIDIAIYYEKIRRTAEVRSSFPYTGSENAICNVFDIIGWYVNAVKVKEEKKDFYLRALFPFEQNELPEKIRKQFVVVLAGGADKRLLEKSPFAVDKYFKPRQEAISTEDRPGTYRAIEPIANGLDIIEITTKILNGE